MVAITVVSLSITSYASFNIENPKDIIIAQPGMNYTTNSPNISILGASDWGYPLYLNGKKVDTTSLGFFAVYLPLEPGQNDFVFKNNDKTKIVVINYKPSNPSGNTQQVTNLNFDPKRYLYLEGSTPIYGVVKVNNGTRAKDNLETSDLINPLSIGTKAKIVGEDKYFYMLSDYSFVYKSGMDIFEGYIPQNYITNMRVSDNVRNNSSEIYFKMNEKPLYDYEFDGNKMTITFYESLNWVPMKPFDNKLISSITPIVTKEKTNCQFEIQLDKGSLVNGVYIEHKDGEMVIGFKKVPKIEGESLKGVKIFIDPGHGGGDPGAFGPLKTYGPMEKDINLEISKFAVKYLESIDAQVITTRQEDVGLSLSERTNISIEEKPDLSLSIHSNSTAVTNDYSNIKGYRTYHTFTIPLPESEDGVSFISRRVAEIAGLNFSNKTRSNLALSRTQYCPALIFEIGFVSNPDDYQWLLQEENHKIVGEAIGRATYEWFKKLSSMKAFDSESVKVLVNGEKVAFDVEPFIEEGRTLVPIRRIFEALGGEVSWDEINQTVKVTKGNQVLTFVINEKTYSINGDEKAMDVPAKIVKGDRTVVPLRAFSEAFGFIVNWDETTRTVTIDG